jgi:hypothetical protein
VPEGENIEVDRSASGVAEASFDVENSFGALALDDLGDDLFSRHRVCAKFMGRN